MPHKDTSVAIKQAINSAINYDLNSMGYNYSRP